ncbi:MAG: WYL domain-containing protein [Acidimicrobiia bacterium]|nr:WYL domain-containing protein [Acidimicrobiia bacterium]
MQNVVERILNLLAFLLTVERPVTAEEIRHTVAGYDQGNDEAWRRMFERDKDLLRQLGIPLELRPTDVWEVEHGYVVDQDEWALPDPGLTDEERAALLLAASVVQIGGSATGPEALLKLGGAPVGAAGEPLAADLGSDQVTVADAFVAVGERRLVDFTYRDKARRVAPYGLVHRRGHWYLVGEDRGDTTVKVFRLDRIPDLATSGEAGAFRRPEGFDASTAIPHAPWEAGGEDLMATVRFDAPIAWWARRQLGTNNAIEVDDDGNLIATLQVANPEAFIGWILAFDDQAEVLDPPELRARLLDRVAGVG